MPLSHRDYKRILELIDLLYSIPDRTAMFQAFFEELQRVIPINSGGYFGLDAQTLQIQTRGSVLINASEVVLNEFASRYAPAHPCLADGYLFSNPNQAVRLTDRTSLRLVQESQYGKEFREPQSIFYEMLLAVAFQGDLMAGMGFNRDRGDKDFSSRDQEIINLLVPHLARRLHECDVIETVLASLDVGVITLGADGAVLSMNDEARRTLGALDRHQIPNPDNAAGPTFFKTPTGIYRVRALSLGRGRRGKMLLLEPTPSESTIKSRIAVFGLTPRQQEIALLAIRGLSNSEIADRLHISRQTVKDHLQDVFEALRVHGRPGLVAKVLGLTF